MVGLGRGAGKTRVGDDDLAAGLLRMQHVQHRHRVRLGRVRTHEPDRFRVLHVVIGVGHRAVTPGVGDARDRGRVADARLVVGVVGAEQAHELAHQVGLLVVVLARSDPVGGVRAALLPDREQLVADLIDRLLPGDALVLAVLQLHRIFQAVRMLGHAVLAHRGALGAVRAEIERRVEYRLLPHPHAVLHHRVDGTADGAVGADGALDFGLATGGLVVGSLGTADQLERQLAGQGRERGARAHRHAGALEERAAVDGLGQHAGQASGQAALRRGRSCGFPCE